MDRVCAAPVQRIMAAKGLEEGQIIVDWLGNMTQVGFALHCTGLLLLHCHSLQQEDHCVSVCGKNKEDRDY